MSNNRQIRIEYEKLSDIACWPRNPKDHDISTLQESFGRFGFVNPIIINEKTGELIAGHGRTKALVQRKKSDPDSVPDGIMQKGDDWLVPVVRGVYLDETDGHAYAVTDNRTPELGGWDSEALLEVLTDLATEGQLEGTGFREDDLEGLLDGLGNNLQENDKEEARKTLAERFVVPPFSILDTKQGYWQARKRAWVALGIQGELGRGEKDSYGRSFVQDIMRGEHIVGGTSRKEADRRSNLNKAPVLPDWATKTGTENMAPGTSIFDPVLCEVIYKWFLPDNGKILDPFAGESTKGVVAELLGYQYTGVELRSEQVEANKAQAKKIGVSPTWVCGDSANLDKLLPDGGKYDLVFTSPPYYDLEVYSNEESDGSALGTYDEFMEWYHNIFKQVVERLNYNCFLVVKVGEIRDKKGVYRNFVGDNIGCFLDLGLGYYNEAILVTPPGSLPIRVSKQFTSGRKLGKMHQNILVFFKGDPKAIKGKFPSEIECIDIAEQEDC